MSVPFFASFFFGCLSPSLLPSSLVVCPLLCFLLLWLSVSLLTPEEDICCGKHLYTIVSLYFAALLSTSVFPRSVLFCQPHQQLFTHSWAVSSQRFTQNVMLCVRICFPPNAGLSCRVLNWSGRWIPLLWDWICHISHTTAERESADGHHLCQTGFATSLTLQLNVSLALGGTECNKPCCRFTGAVSIL